jgi:NADH-quinone oxidoreductase subunit A
LKLETISSWGQVILFTIGGLLFVSLALLVSKIIRPSRPNEEKLTSYESGEEPIGSPWIQFNVRFYVITLIFILFEVEVVFLFPWATIFSDKELLKSTNGTWGMFAMTEMMIFVGMLVLGLAYAWKNGHLDWIKSKPEVTDFQSPVPKELYKKINEQYSRK